MSNKEPSNKELNIETEVLDDYLDNKEIEEEGEDEQIEDEDEQIEEGEDEQIEDKIDEDNETSNISLQLGDIIELYAPSNSDLHSHRFYIKFINSNKIELLNDKKEITLEINKEGKFLEESIENIILLYRQSSPSYIIQNNLSLNRNISIYFGEPNPQIINGKITNIEEDMMEVTLIPSNDVIYIDFGYSGIPEKMNIEKIIIRDDKSSAEELKYNVDEEEKELIKKESELLEGSETQHLDLANDNYLDDDLIFDSKESLKEDFLNFDEDEEEEEIEFFHNVNVSDEEKRYSIEEQINDYLDNMLNVNVNETEDTTLSKEKINHEIERYLQLRNIYSDFDENNNANAPPLKGEFYKPLKELLINLNKKLYWLLPVCSNKKNIYLDEEELGNNDDSNEDDYFKENDITEYITDLNAIINNWSKNTSKEKVNNYKKYINDLLNIFENNTIKYSKDNFLINVNSQINIINDINDDFYSYVFKNKEISKDRFVTEVCNSGLNMLESYYFESKKRYKMKNLTQNDKIAIISFITLPLPVFNFSRINLEYTSIYERSNLNNNFLNYYKLLNKNTNVNLFNNDSKMANNFLNSHETIHEDSLFDNINNFSNTSELLTDFSMEDEENKESIETKYNNLMESFIPTNYKIITALFEKDKIKIYNVKQLINSIQSANIDLYKLHANDMKLITTNLSKSNSDYKTLLKNNASELEKIINKLNSDLNVDTKDSYYGFDLLNEELKNDMFEIYELNKNELKTKYNNNEIIQYFFNFDNCKMFLNALNKNIIDLIVANLLENFVTQSKKLKSKDANANVNANGEEDGDGSLKTDNSDCESYTLSKKYLKIEELELDNNKLTYFDAIYDKTFYSIIQEFENEKESMDSKQFFGFLTNKIMESMNFTKKKALREAKAIIEEKKEIIDGDYALLVDKKSNKKSIFIRKNNTWIVDEKFKDDFYIDSNKIFCDSNKECITKDDKCISKDKLINENLKEDVDKILENFESNYNLSIEEIKGKINTNYENAKNYIKKLIKINRQTNEKTNDFLLNLDETFEINTILSPYDELKNIILSYPNIAKRQEFIKDFCIKNTRNAINDEEVYWLYCNKTGAKLIPSFLLKLANVFNDKKQYLITLDTICADQGTISDDNSYWVDKYSGYIIKAIEFNGDEGYDESGYKLNTKDVLENDYNVNMGNVKSLNPDIDTIKAITKSVTHLIGINIDNHISLIVNNVLKLQTLLPSKEAYEKAVLKATKKEGKSGKAMQNYEDTYNLSLLLLTLMFIIVSIQINIPSIKSKKTFPGCIKSFNGFPFEDSTDKTLLNYIACVAGKMKSSIKPWNSILKTSQSSLVKKLENLIEKHVLQNAELLELYEKKHIYLQKNDYKEDITNEVFISWDNFMPKLVDFTISIENSNELGDTFNSTYLEAITKGQKHNHYESLQSKIIYTSNSIIESIQKIVAKEATILENNNGEPFLENACCNSSKNSIKYFIKKDNSIIKNNELINLYSDFLNSIHSLSKPYILYDINNTKIAFPTLPNYYSEEIIYKGFIFYCNFNNSIPISDELMGICMNKPQDFNGSLNIKELIESLKSEGKVYNKDNFEQLLDVINKQNITFVGTQIPIINNIEKIRLLIESYLKMDSQYLGDEMLINKLKDVLDVYDISNKNNDYKELIDLKNYLLRVNSVMKNNILGKLKTISNISKAQYSSIEQFLDFEFNINYINFYKNYITNLLKIFPNIMLNKSIDVNKIPSHWNLSELHNNDITNILKRYYTPLFGLNVKEELRSAINILTSNNKLLLEILEYVLYNEPIVLDSETKIPSIFDKDLLQFLYYYVYYNLINELLNISSNEEFIIEATSYEKHDANEFDEFMVNYILEFSNIMNNHYKLLNSGYKKVKENVYFAKEKEKDLITDYLKDLSEEEREIENIFKNSKLEKWSKGLQKGVTQYVKDNYDEERAALESQALKEKMLNKNNNVTAMNKEIYMMDLEEKMQADEEIEAEENTMDNIPDDDNMDSDYEY